eukprot:TRINITY_DN10832_c0_g1_i2.p1 TRINITY_DN10832_c0_g1~~TRINITY_DN10832_c0_g1_i2.p1  ORF type:complete len:276 (-),score=51.60 TRINITY_DN10832_c0_g1_i2:440-1267(-)
MLEVAELLGQAAGDTEDSGVRVICVQFIWNHRMHGYERSLSCIWKGQRGLLSCGLVCWVDGVSDSNVGLWSKVDPDFIRKVVVFGSVLYVLNVIAVVILVSLTNRLVYIAITFGHVMLVCLLSAYFTAICNSHIKKYHANRSHKNLAKHFSSEVENFPELSTSSSYSISFWSTGSKNKENQVPLVPNFAAADEQRNQELKIAAMRVRGGLTLSIILVVWNSAAFGYCLSDFGRQETLHSALIADPDSYTPSGMLFIGLIDIVLYLAIADLLLHGE